MEVMIKKGKCKDKFHLPKIIKIKGLNLKYKFTHNIETLGWENHMNRLFGFSIGFSSHKNSFSFVYNDLNGEVYAQYVIDSRLKLHNMRIYNTKKEPVFLSIIEKSYGVEFEAKLEGSEIVSSFRVTYIPVSDYGVILRPLYGIKSYAKKDIKFKLEKFS